MGPSVPVMQKEWKKYPFLWPLIALLLGVSLWKCGLCIDPLVGAGWIVFMFIIWWIIGTQWPNVRTFVWLALHLILGNVWFGNQSESDWAGLSKSFGNNHQPVYALMEVRDSWMSGAKGMKGTVHCLGFKSRTGAFTSWNGDFRVSLKSYNGSIDKGPEAPSIGPYWVDVKHIQAYPLPEVPGAMNWRSVMHSLGIEGYIERGAKWYKAHGNAHGNARKQVSWMYRSRSRLLVWLNGEFRRRLHPQHAALVYAMLIGDKSGLDPETESQFGVAGLLHVLAVSGMHVALIMGALFWIFTGFGARGRLGVGWLLCLLAAGWGYAFLTGGSAAVVRAMISATWMWVGKYAFQRKQSLLHVLFGSAYLQFFMDPPCIEQLGCQLSYLAVFGIGWLHPRVVDKLPQASKWGRWMMENTSLTLSATLFTLPLLLWQFQSFPTWFLLGNLLLLPLFSLSVYFALACVLFGWIPFLGDAIYALFNKGLQGVLWLLGKTQSLPLPQIFALPMDLLDLLFLFVMVWAVCGWVACKFLNDAPSFPSEMRWLLVLGMSFCLLWAHLEYTRSRRHQSNQKFVIQWQQNRVEVVKTGSQMKVKGSWRNLKTKNFIWQKLQNYAQQNGVKHVEWINQLPLHHE